MRDSDAGAEGGVLVAAMAFVGGAEVDVDAVGEEDVAVMLVGVRS